MAFTSTRVRRTVLGNLKVEIWSYVATGATSGTIVTGINNIEAVCPDYSTVRASAALDYTTTAGSIALTGLTSGDTGVIVVFGKN